MKRILDIISFLILLTFYTLADSQNMITVLDKGVKRQIPLPPVSSSQKKSIGHTITQNGVLVAFKNTSLLSVSEFETRYGLKLKSKMAIGYYVFENRSGRDDAEIITDIIAHGNNVKTVKPNWRLRNTIR